MERTSKLDLLCAEAGSERIVIYDPHGSAISSGLDHAVYVPMIEELIGREGLVRPEEKLVLSSMLYRLLGDEEHELAPWQREWISETMELVEGAAQVLSCPEPSLS